MLPELDRLAALLPLAAEPRGVGGSRLRPTCGNGERHANDPEIQVSSNGYGQSAMSTPSPGIDLIERKVIQLFALVSEALARATEALLGNNPALGQSVIDGDQDVDDLTSEVEMLVWEQLNTRPVQGSRAPLPGGAAPHHPRAGTRAPIWPNTSPSGQ